jgi:hypothetical protein
MSSVADRRRKAMQAARAERRRAAAISASTSSRQAAVRAEAEAERSPPPKGSVLHRLHKQLTRPQYEAGCRFRDDWHGGLDCKTGDPNPDQVRHATPGDIGHERLMRQGASRGAYDRASSALLRETNNYIHTVAVVVCVRDDHPEAIARRAVEFFGGPESERLTFVMLALKQGLDALARHYAVGSKAA